MKIEIKQVTYNNLSPGITRWEIHLDGICYNWGKSRAEMVAHLDLLSKDYEKQVASAEKALQEATRWLNEVKSDQQEFAEARRAYESTKDGAD